MHRDDVRDAVEHGRQVARQVRVPGVRMDQLRGPDRSRHRQVGGDDAQRLVGVGQLVPRLVRDRADAVRALAVHDQIHQRRQLAGQVRDVHAGPAVHLGRVLAGQQRDPERPRGGLPDARAPGDTELARHGRTSWPLPTTVMPPAETTKPRALSRSLSTPTCAHSGTVTFLSMIASLITAWRPILVLCISTDRSTVAQLFTRTPGESTDCRTRPPEITTPLLTRLSIARPTRSPDSWTNFAGGSDGTFVRIGQSSLYRLNIGSTAHRSIWASK